MLLWKSHRNLHRLLFGLLASLYSFGLLRMQGALDQHHATRPNLWADFKNASNSRQIEQIKYAKYAKPSQEYKIDVTDLWETSNNNLPNWMKKYFRWHKESRQSLSEDNWESFRYLFITCLPQSIKCGGAADRLSDMPFMLQLAASTRRLLLIQWGRPAELEEFLLPPQGGMDWRVPSWLGPKMHFAGERGRVETVLLDLAPKTNLTVLRATFQSHDHGSVWYDAHRFSKTEPTFRQVFHDSWRVMFTPSPPVAGLIETFMEENGLVPGYYAAAHLRALYNTKTRDPIVVESWARNAVNCTSLMSHGGPVFFASDSMVATRAAVEHGKQLQLRVVSKDHSQEPLHLDKAKHWQRRSASEYYDTFVDLYLLAMSNCVAYSMGGFGIFASYISFNSSCAFRHHTAKRLLRCPFVQHQKRQKIPPLRKPIFLLPMTEKVVNSTGNAVATTRVVKEDHQDTRITTSHTEGSGKHQSIVAKEGGGNRSNPFPDPRLRLSNLWEASTKLPLWMKTYFDWHRNQRTLLNRENWKDFRYLAIVCLGGQTKCGGTSDRLRPLLFFVRVAAETNRILFILWEKPAPLEAFLVPPSGGVDWRTPGWLADHIRNESGFAPSVAKLVQAALDKKNVIVRSKVQAHDHGNNYYNARGKALGEPWDAFRQHYHDCWYVMFTPVPPIARKIEDEMERLQLVPGEYAFAHVRALYGVEGDSRDPEIISEWTVNSLNCVSSLRPGGPFFFSSDSLFAKKVAVEYGKKRNTTVVTRMDDRDPLHLGLTTDWKQRDPSEFYDVFVDLYLMSMGKCMSYNMGGYGKWALLISGRNFTCNVRHWTYGVSKATANKEGCNWTEPFNSIKEPKPIRHLQGPLFLPPMEGEA